MSLFSSPKPYPELSAQARAERAQARAPALRRRLAAFVYEGVLLFGVLMAVGAVYSIAVNQRHGLEGRNGMMAALFLALAVYFMWFWSRSGQTLADKTWHLRVVAHDGRPIRLPQALRRYLAAWLWFLPPWALAWSLGWHQSGQITLLTAVWLLLYALSSFVLPRRQFLHDVLAGTCLIDTRP